MTGKVFISVLLLAFFIGGQDAQRRDSKMSLEEAKENLSDFVREGFSEASKRAPRENHPEYTLNHHGRKIPSKYIQSLRCLEHGYKRTNKLILDSVHLPKGMTKKQALERLSYPETETEMISKACNAPHLLKKEKESQIREFESVDREFRTLDGTGNHPDDLGSGGTLFTRLLEEAVYADEECGLVNREANRQTVRDISNLVSPETPALDEDTTVLFMQFGQFIDHDITLMVEQVEIDECCGEDELEECSDVIVGDSDPVFPPETCLPFPLTSSLITINNTGSCEDRINLATTFLDGSQIYGLTQEQHDDIRKLGTPLLLIDDEIESTLEDFSSCACSAVPPLFLSFLPEDPNPNEEFLTGDIRVNEQPALASIHTIFVRYHNLLAKSIWQQNQFLDPEDTFELARMFVIGSLQHITYNEFLPGLLSDEFLTKFALLSSGDDFVYNPDIGVGTLHEFAGAAFRMGHTLIPDVFKTLLGDVALINTFMNASVLRNAISSPSSLLNAEASNLAPAFDSTFSNAIRNELFANVKPPGQDLYVRNILRGRDIGLGNFNDYRMYFDLDPINNRRELINVTRTRSAALNLRDAYARINDLDLFPAGLSEQPINVPGDKLGPVFSSIIGEQFKRIKFGDRLFYLNDVFTGEELDAIKATKLSDILCEVTLIDVIQDYALKGIHPITNPTRSCLSRRRNRDNIGTVASLVMNAEFA